MFRRVRQYICMLPNRIGRKDFVFVLIPAVVFIASLIVRLSTGGTYLIYSALDSKGIFPDNVSYTILYAVRTVLLGLIAAYLLCFCREQRGYLNTILPLTIACVMFVLEYRMIFGGVSLILSIVFSLAVPILTLLSIIRTYIIKLWIFVLWIIFAVLQAVLFVQLISLSMYI
ncbi:MAG: hypothetical protein IJA52_09080 [Clostridia bacterium]|nr:hypothetical protein [Clostridia bacterium]